jgi:hypothetical protein
VPPIETVTVEEKTTPAPPTKRSYGRKSASASSSASSSTSTAHTSSKETEEKPSKETEEKPSKEAEEATGKSVESAMQAPEADTASAMEIDPPSNQDAAQAALLAKEEEERVNIKRAKLVRHLSLVFVLHVKHRRLLRRSATRSSAPPSAFGSTS